MPTAKIPLVLGADGLVQQLQTDDAMLVTVDALEQSPDTPDYNTLVGSPDGDFAGVSLLEAMMDDASGLGLGVRVLNQPKVGPDGGLVISDGKKVDLSLAVGGVLIVDTLGYQTLQISSSSLGANVFVSNDLITWNGIQLTYTGAGGAAATAVFAGLTLQIPCTARYVRFVAITAGAATGYLRTAATVNFTNLTPVNLNLLNNQSVASAGLAGVFPVGGVGAPGILATAANTGNPVLSSGVDSNGFKRTLVVDPTGAQVAAGHRPPAVPDTKTPNPLPFYVPPPPIRTQDAMEQDANGGLLDTLRIISLLLRSIDLRLQELPARLNGSQPDTDDFTAIREDLSLMIN